MKKQSNPIKHQPVYWLIALAAISGAALTMSASFVPDPEEWKAPAYADTLKNPLEGNVKATAEGKKIYEKMCWACHGLSGKGDGPGAAACSPKPADHSSKKIQQQKDGALFWKISNGRGKMQPYDKTLSKTQRWQLVNYIRTLGQNTSGQ